MAVLKGALGNLIEKLRKRADILCARVAMSQVEILNVQVLDNPSPYFNPFQFEIAFRCLAPLAEGTHYSLESIRLLGSNTRITQNMISTSRFISVTTFIRLTLKPACTECFAGVN